MPHAALWVVQLDTVWAEAYERGRFNAARGFVGGAARKNRRSQKGHMRVSMPHAALWVVQQDESGQDGQVPHRFNAARGFVGGAASRLL